MSIRCCHKCHFLKYDYDSAKMHEDTFLYGCNDNVALTTNELKGDCFMKGNLHDNYDDGRARSRTLKVRL